jgi:hypothetical protein
MTTAAHPFAHFNYDFNEDTAGAANAAGGTPVTPALVGMPLMEFIESVQTKHWAVDGLVIEDGITVLGGDPESFKSTGAHNIAMAYSRAWDGEWLGLPVSEGPVIYLSNEKAATSLRDRFKAMVEDGDEPKHPFLVVHNKVRVSMTPAVGQEPWSALVDTVRTLRTTTGKPVLLIIDTLTSCGPLGYDENNNMQVSDYLSNLKLARDAGATILLIHHYSKNGSTNGGGAMALRGGTALAGDIDGSGLFQRTDPEQARGEVRLWPKEGERKRITFSVDAGGTFRMTTAEARIVLLTTDMVIDAVRNGAGTNADIFDAVKDQITGITRDQVRNKVKEIVAAGLITKAHRTAPFTVIPNDADSSGGRQPDADGRSDSQKDNDL